jgi:hypothetical protein
MTMADDTNTAERASFEAHYRRCGATDETLSRWVDDGSTPPAMVGKYIIRSVQDAWLAFQAGRASLAASAGSEPVAWLVCTEEGDPSMVFLSQHEAQQYLEDDERPTPLYTHPSPPEGAGAEQALRKVLSVVQRYLPPNGPTAHDAMSEITAIVDPWPLCPLEKP